ncbi:hypothetical protein [Paenibacillus donghaensis]|uniref:YgiT-type zinc finger domain-containing protein n=1 Tax=Paenibacillus donghaensis TaxID=414771 RepID=A0A2Z2KDD0_9BACL|nr:hypothetical protein [Paenibacillus donghaensis]ASA21013.1 hypothetical protein B9T62_09570 [Paenibacillus donghaensis]
MPNDELMRKTCSCGGVMTIHMHTLIYNARTKITNVPVYTCRDCARYEPLPMIKQDLADLITGMGGQSLDRSRRHYSFADHNEWAGVLKETFAKSVTGGLEELELRIRTAIQSRIDLLLDIYRFAADHSDQEWMEETGRRLSQLTQHSLKSAK